MTTRRWRGCSLSFMVRSRRRSASAGSSTGCRCCGRATSWTRGCRAKRRSSPTTGSCCSRAFFVLFATMFPTITELINGERLTVGPPFFNRWMTPIGLALLLLTGIGPLLAWRKSTTREPARPVPLPGVARRWWSAVGVVALGVRVWSSGHLLRAVRVRLRHDRAGVLARRERPPRRRPAPTS